jgi:hypothetical protein
MRSHASLQTGTGADVGSNMQNALTLPHLSLAAGLETTACLVVRTTSESRLQRWDAVRRYSVSFCEQVLHQKSLEYEDMSVCSAVRMVADKYGANKQSNVWYPATPHFQNWEGKESVSSMCLLVPDSITDKYYTTGGILKNSVYKNILSLNSSECSPFKIGHPLWLPTPTLTPLQCLETLQVWQIIFRKSFSSDVTWLRKFSGFQKETFPWL